MELSRMLLPRQAGFTLIELMVTLTVVAVLAIVAVPSFQTVINSSRLTAAANEYIAAVQTARNDAIRYNRRVVVCLSVVPNLAAPACAPNNAINARGWIVFVDANNDGTYQATERLLRIATVHEAVGILGSSNMDGKVKVAFRSDGLARRANGTLLSGTVDMCIKTTIPRENGRHVAVRAGSVAISRFTNVACPEPGNNT